MTRAPRREAAGLAARSAAVDDRAARRAGPETLPFPRARTTPFAPEARGATRARAAATGAATEQTQADMFREVTVARDEVRRARGQAGGSISNPRGPTWRRLRPALTRRSSSARRRYSSSSAARPMTPRGRRLKLLGGCERELVWTLPDAARRMEPVEMAEEDLGRADGAPAAPLDRCVPHPPGETVPRHPSADFSSFAAHV